MVFNRGYRYRRAAWRPQDQKVRTVTHKKWRTVCMPAVCGALADGLCFGQWQYRKGRLCRQQCPSRLLRLRVWFGG